MKESIGGTQIFLIVISLILIFSGIMALTINRTNAFAVKDQLVSIIERAGGFDMDEQLDPNLSYPDDNVLKQIVDSLEHNSYRQTGKCPEPTANTKVSAYQRNGSSVSWNNEASFCIVQIDGMSPEGVPDVYYYQIIVFYSLDLPVLNTLFNFKAIGETKALYS